MIFSFAAICATRYKTKYPKSRTKYQAPHILEGNECLWRPHWLCCPPTLLFTHCVHCLRNRRQRRRKGDVQVISYQSWSFDLEVEMQWLLAFPSSPRQNWCFSTPRELHIWLGYGTDFRFCIYIFASVGIAEHLCIPLEKRGKSRRWWNRERAWSSLQSHIQHDI